MNTTWNLICRPDDSECVGYGQETHSLIKKVEIQSYQQVSS